MSEKVDIQKVITDETEKRLAKMQSPDYVFPTKMGKLDFTLVIASCVISLVLIVLCMCGVIV